MMDSENEDYSGGENVTGLIWAVIVLFVDTTKFTYCFKVDSSIVGMLLRSVLEDVTGLIWAVIVLFVDNTKFKIFFFFIYLY